MNTFSKILVSGLLAIMVATFMLGMVINTTAPDQPTVTIKIAEGPTPTPTLPPGSSGGCQSGGC